MNEIDELKSRINIVDIVGAKVRLKKSGVNYFGLCPFHNEKTGSFSVNEQLQIFKCFGCGESGDVIKFIEKTENLSFREVLEELSEKTGYKLKGTLRQSQGDTKFEAEKNKLYELNLIVANFYQSLLNEMDSHGMEYARKRNLEGKLIEKFKIGYASQSSQNLYTYLKQLNYSDDYLISSGVCVRKEGKKDVEDKFKERLIFSIFDQKGKLVGFSGRYIGPDKKDYSPPKYLNSPETIVFNKSKTLFGLYQAQEAIRKLKFVILSEGQMNILSSHRVGVQNIVASLGTSFTPDHLQLLRRYSSSIYLAFDKDNAGKKALLRTLEMIFSSDAEINCKVIYWDPKLGKDPDEVISVNKKFWIEAVDNAMDPIEYLIYEFNQRFASPSINTKDAFLKVIAPIVSKHRNLFKREAYLKQLAESFGITPDQLKQTYLRGENRYEKQNSTQINQTPAITNIPEKRNDIFDSYFALTLQNWDLTKGLLIGIDRDFVIDEYVELYDCLSLYVDAENITEIRETLEDDALKFFDDLVLKKIDMDQNLSAEEHLLKSIPNLIRAKYAEVIKLYKADPENMQLLAQKNKLAGALLEYSRK